MRVLSEQTIRNIRLGILERDNGRCVICYSRPVQVHEIRPRSEHTYRAQVTFRFHNMVCLCNQHHYRWHNDKDFRDRALISCRRYIKSQ